MTIKDKKLADLLDKHDSLDDNCQEIFLTLLAYGSLRHNELMRTLKKLGVKMERPTLDTHLTHLMNIGLVECTTAFQFSNYTLTKDVASFLGALSPEEVKKWVENLRRTEYLDKHLQPIKFDRKEYFKKVTDKQLDKIVSDDLNNTLSLNLYEFKNFIDYDLKLDRFDDNSAFWKLIGNPIYRMHEKSIVEKCRDSERYKKLFFEKIALLIAEYRSDKVS